MRGDWASGPSMRGDRAGTPRMRGVRAGRPIVRGVWADRSSMRGARAGGSSPRTAFHPRLPPLGYICVQAHAIVNVSACATIVWAGHKDPVR